MKTHARIFALVVLLAFLVPIGLTQAQSNCNATFAQSQDGKTLTVVFTGQGCSVSQIEKIHIIVNGTSFPDIPVSVSGAVSTVSSVIDKFEGEVSHFTSTTVHNFVDQAGHILQTIPVGTIIHDLGNGVYAIKNKAGQWVTGAINFVTGNSPQPQATAAPAVTNLCTGTSGYYVVPENSANTYSDRTQLSFGDSFVIQNTGSIPLKLRPAAGLGQGGEITNYSDGTQGIITGPFTEVVDCASQFHFREWLVTIGTNTGYMAEASNVAVYMVRSNQIPPQPTAVSNRFNNGDTVQVINSPATDPLNCRADHKKLSAKVFPKGITDGMRGTIIAGPVTEDNHNWYQVTIAGLTCWAPEGEGSQMWLEKIQS